MVGDGRDDLRSRHRPRRSRPIPLWILGMALRIPGARLQPQRPDQLPPIRHDDKPQRRGPLSGPGLPDGRPGGGSGGGAGQRPARRRLDSRPLAHGPDGGDELSQHQPGHPPQRARTAAQGSRRAQS